MVLFKSLILDGSLQVGGILWGDVDPLVLVGEVLWNALVFFCDLIPVLEVQDVWEEKKLNGNGLLLQAPDLEAAPEHGGPVIVHCTDQEELMNKSSMF